VVDASTAAVLRKEIARKLGLLRDPDSRQRVVTDVIDVAAEGRVDGFGDRAPDLIVGFNRGYRSSDESALGAVGDVVIERNREKWSGDHCMDARLVPGILVTSFALPDGARPTLADLAPTVLDYFAVDADPAIAGQSLLSKEETR
jgi:predicted AlkP superfamily phosphohydrolase/phosphomutase